MFFKCFLNFAVGFEVRLKKEKNKNEKKNLISPIIA